MRDFAGRVAVVTGAASGMGRAFAERFAREGMAVVLADVEEAALEAAVTALKRQELDVLGVRTDVARMESVQELARRAVEAFGKVHLLCNNAGVGTARSLIWESPPEDWQWALGVNLWGIVNGVRAFLPSMLDHGEEGHIVNTASIAGLKLPDGIYGVTKHAAVAYTETLYRQLRRLQAKVGVSALCPSYVRTRIGEAERNRPPELRLARPPEPAHGQRNLFRERAGLALEPAQVADVVLEAIREERFYIFAYPDDEERRLDEERIRARVEDILAGRNPGLDLQG